MNKNIFSPKGKIDELTFVFYYILLIVFYIVFGIFMIMYVHRHNLDSIYYVVPFLFLKLLIVFNYKKRLTDIGLNLFWSVFAGIILTFDVDTTVFCALIKNTGLSMLFFWLAFIFFVFVQPAIVALIPSKNSSCDSE